MPSTEKGPPATTTSTCSRSTSWRATCVSVANSPDSLQPRTISAGRPATRTRCTPSLGFLPAVRAPRTISGS
jgi:hypothetical protein